VTAPTGTQTFGAASCPGSKQPSGGGAFVESSSLTVNLNSSYPIGQSWAVDVNNTSGASTTFTVYVICMKASAKYTVVSVEAPLVPESTQSASAECPIKTSAVGGGVASITESTGININSSVPDALLHGRTEWTAAVGNDTDTSPNFIVYAICRPKPKGYSIQYGNGVSATSGAETGDAVTCPGASVPIGGGGFTGYSTADTLIGMNSSYASGNTWVVYENNGGTIARSLYAAVVCAGT
jgi:hypothetical protein